MKKALLAAAVACFPLTAIAQVHPQRPPAQVIIFSDCPIDGQTMRPSDTYFAAKRRTTFPSLVRLRSSFVPELQRSVDAL